MSLEDLFDDLFGEDGYEKISYHFTVVTRSCPVCTYGEPTAHTCDEGQQKRYEAEKRRND